MQFFLMSRLTQEVALQFLEITGWQGTKNFAGNEEASLKLSNYNLTANDSSLEIVPDNRY